MEFQLTTAKTKSSRPTRVEVPGTQVGGRLVVHRNVVSAARGGKVRLGRLYTLSTADGEARLHVDFKTELDALNFAKRLLRNSSVDWRRYAQALDRSERARDRRESMRAVAPFVAAELRALPPPRTPYRFHARKAWDRYFDLP